MGKTNELEPLDPRTGMEMYLQNREQEVAEATLRAHEDRLRLFVEWCEENDIKNLNNLTGRDVHRFKLWRQSGIKVDGISTETLRSALLTLRVFLRWAVSIDGVRPSIPEQIVMPDGVKRSRDVMLDADQAEQILTHLSKYHYADDPHVILRILWVCGMRAGALRALDVGDYDPDDQYLDVRHRPDEGTALKNKEEGQRAVALDDRTCQVIDDHLATHRPSVIDDYGREPLIATAQGRRSRQSIRRTCYWWTCPCRSGDCPHDKDPDTCEHNEYGESSTCPSSVSSHPIRRGAITHFLRSDVPVASISQRMDLSAEVLDGYYDQRGRVEKMEQRRGYLDNI